MHVVAIVAHPDDADILPAREDPEVAKASLERSDAGLLDGRGERLLDGGEPFLGHVAEEFQRDVGLVGVHGSQAADPGERFLDPCHLLAEPVEVDADEQPHVRWSGS